MQTSTTYISTASQPRHAFRQKGCDSLWSHKHKFYFAEVHREGKEGGIPAGYLVSQHQLSTVLKGPCVPQAQLGVACSNWVDLHRMEQHPDMQVFAGMSVANLTGAQKHRSGCLGRKRSGDSRAAHSCRVSQHIPKKHIPHTHHTGAEDLTLALVSLLPKHAPGQEKTQTQFNGRTVVLQIVYRGQCQNAGGSWIIRSHGRAAQQ